MQAPRLSGLGRLVDAWYQNEARAVWILLGSFVVVWTSFHVISNAAIGLHPDNLEMYTWARHPGLGYPPHPPLGAWMVGAWFALFPATDWSFHLLTMVNSAVALYAVDLIARRYVEGDKRLLVLLLLLLMPFYQFRGQRFSVNLTLLSTWPIATYCFLRAFESRTAGWAAAAGTAAALAMLGKYYSIYLVAAFILAALAHEDRWSYLKSSSPWISIIAGFLVLAPHIYWLVTTGFQPFHYALVTHAGASPLTAFAKAGSYAIGGIAYVALPVAVFMLATRTGPRALAASLWPSQPRLRMLAVLMWVPLVLPMLTAPFFGAVLTPLWTMQGWFLLPILLLAPAQVALSRASAVKVGIGVIATTAAVIIAAPAIALMRHSPGKSAFLTLRDKDARVNGKAIAARVTQLWHDTAGRPLTIVAGSWNPPPYALTFYSPDHPDSIVNYELALSPWITAERLAREGWLAVCAAEDQACLSAADTLATSRQQPRRVEFDQAATFFGWQRPAEHYVALLFLPREAAKN